jgi:hypothetical protein
MRKFITLCVVLVQTLVFGQNQGNAILTWQVNSYDFGRIMEKNGKVLHRFLFTNTGTDPLLITNVRTNCGCTVPIWSKNPVLPGNEGFVEVEFNPEGHQGAFQKTIQVQSTAQNSNMFLTVKGTIIPPVELENLPYKLGDLYAKSNHINLGYLYRGDTGIETLIVANTTSHTIDIDFGSVPAHIDLKAVPKVLQPGEFGRIEIQYWTKKLDDWDVVIDQIPVILNNIKSDDVKLTITANIREDFRNLTQEQITNAPVAKYTNDVFNCDTISQDDQVETRFLVRNNGKSDLVIRAVKPSCGCTAAKPVKNILAPGDSAYIDAVFDPKGRSGAFRNGITIVTNDPIHYKKFLFLEGYIKN